MRPILRSVEAPASPGRLMAQSLVGFLAAAALVAMLSNVVVAVALIETAQVWPRALAVAYLISAVAVHAAAAYRTGRGSGLRLARRAAVASMAVSLFAAPLTVSALIM